MIKKKKILTLLPVTALDISAKGNHVPLTGSVLGEILFFPVGFWALHVPGHPHGQPPSWDLVFLSEAPRTEHNLPGISSPVQTAGTLSPPFFCSPYFY